MSLKSSLHFYLPLRVRILTHPTESRENDETHIEVLMAVHMLSKPSAGNVEQCQDLLGLYLRLWPEVILCSEGAKESRTILLQHLMYPIVLC